MTTRKLNPQQEGERQTKINRRKKALIFADACDKRTAGDKASIEAYEDAWYRYKQECGGPLPAIRDATRAALAGDMSYQDVAKVVRDSYPDPDAADNGSQPANGTSEAKTDGNQPGTADVATNQTTGARPVETTQKVDPGSNPGTSAPVGGATKVPDAGTAAAPVGGDTAGSAVGASRGK